MTYWVDHGRRFGLTFSILVSLLLTGHRLLQQLSADESTEQPNGRTCGKHLEDIVLWAWHTGMCIHRPMETIHISWVLRVCKVMQIWGPSLNTEIPTVKWVHWINGEGHEADNEEGRSSKRGCPSLEVGLQGYSRGPGKLNLAEAMTQCKFRALLLVKQHLSTWKDESRETVIQQKQRQAE